MTSRKESEYFTMSVLKQVMNTQEKAQIAQENNLPRVLEK